jgi:hypothetical protein
VSIGNSFDRPQERFLEFCLLLAKLFEVLVRGELGSPLVEIFTINLH